MGDLLKFVSDEGGTVLVEVATDMPGQVTRGGRAEAVVVDAGETLEGVLGRLGPVIKGIASELRKGADWPDEVEIEFAVKLSADSDVIIARASGEANFRIVLRWSGERER